MAGLAELSKHELAWVENPDESGAYSLVAGKEHAGSLRFEAGSRSRAEAELAGYRWTLERDDSHWGTVVVHEPGDPQPLATFSPRWKGGGLVKFRSGVNYCWNPSHIWSTTYCFRREGHKASVCVSEHAPAKTGARVGVCADAAGLPETPVLVVLGWFLEILVFERMGTTAVSLS